MHVVSMSRRKSVAVIGGGAAGLACAARAAHLARQRGASVKVAIFEADSKIGKPILRSGNGRCNLSNAKLDVSAYHNAGFVADALAAAERSCADEVATCEPAYRARSADEAFFANRGLLLREEGEGRLYPYPNKASAVLDLLRGALDACKVDAFVDSRVSKVVVRSGACGGFGACGAEGAHGKGSASRPFALHLEDGRVQHFDAVVCAVGGVGIRSLVSAIELEGARADACSGAGLGAGAGMPAGAGADAAAGMSEAAGDSAGELAGRPFLRPQLPKLCPIAVSSKLVRELDNIRVKCVVSLCRAGATVADERGEVLFRKYGISGIAAFNLSRFVEPGDSICIDLVPELDVDSLAALMRGRVSALERSFGERASNARTLDGVVLPAVAKAVMASAGISPGSLDVDPERLACALKSFELSVEGLAEPDKAQVHRGGVSVDAVSAETLELRAIPGMFVVGEALDVDGPCGGYNLHFAWMSGLLAASSALDSLCLHGGADD